MEGVVSQRFGLMVPHGKLDECIPFLEGGLRSLKPTPYHCVLGKDFLAQADDLADWLIDFHKVASDDFAPAAVYLEMNGFTINPGEWHCHLFGYKSAGDVWELDWLAGPDAEFDERFVLHGMESVQAAFAEVFLDERRPLGVGLAEEITEHLVTARFMQLVAAAHRIAKQEYAPLDGLPVLATAHDWDVVHRTT